MTISNAFVQVDPLKGTIQVLNSAIPGVPGNEMMCIR
jgi:hypothetical protein